jgi:hypothetical protein
MLGEDEQDTIFEQLQLMRKNQEYTIPKPRPPSSPLGTLTSVFHESLTTKIFSDDKARHFYQSIAGLNTRNTITSEKVDIIQARDGQGPFYTEASTLPQFNSSLSTLQTMSDYGCGLEEDILTPYSSQRGSPADEPPPREIKVDDEPTPTVDDRAPERVEFPHLEIPKELFCVRRELTDEHVDLIRRGLHLRFDPGEFFRRCDADRWGYYKGLFVRNGSWPTNGHCDQFALSLCLNYRGLRKNRITLNEKTMTRGLRIVPTHLLPREDIDTRQLLAGLVLSRNDKYKVIVIAYAHENFTVEFHVGNYKTRFGNACIAVPFGGFLADDYLTHLIFYEPALLDPVLLLRDPPANLDEDILDTPRRTVKKPPKRPLCKPGVVRLPSSADGMKSSDDEDLERQREYTPFLQQQRLFATSSSRPGVLNFDIDQDPPCVYQQRGRTPPPQRVTPPRMYSEANQEVPENLSVILGSTTMLSNGIDVTMFETHRITRFGDFATGWRDQRQAAVNRKRDILIGPSVIGSLVFLLPAFKQEFQHRDNLGCPAMIKLFNDANLSIQWIWHEEDNGFDHSFRWQVIVSVTIEIAQFDNTFKFQHPIYQACRVDTLRYLDHVSNATHAVIDVMVNLDCFMNAPLFGFLWTVIRDFFMSMKTRPQSARVTDGPINTFAIIT